MRRIIVFVAPATRSMADKWESVIVNCKFAAFFTHAF